MRAWYREALRQCRSVAARLGLTPTIANLGWQPVVYGASQQILATCDAVGPELKVTYDVGNYIKVGEDSVEALDRVWPRLVHVHFKDWQIVPRTTAGSVPGVDGRFYLGVALGEGVVNLAGTMKRLRQLGYQGYISVEYDGIGDPWADVRRGVNYLRSLMASTATQASDS